MGRDKMREEEGDPPVQMRIRTGEVYSSLAIPLVLALLGLVWNYHSSTEATFDSKLRDVRAEIQSLRTECLSRVDRLWERVFRSN